MEINVTGRRVTPVGGGGSALLYKVVMESLLIALHVSRN